MLMAYNVMKYEHLKSRAIVISVSQQLKLSSFTTEVEMGVIKNDTILLPILLYDYVSLMIKCVCESVCGVCFKSLWSVRYIMHELVC